jgi:hypothetical protein
MLSLSKSALVVGLLGLMLLGIPDQARADILLTLNGTSTSNGQTTYTYNVFLQPQAALNATGATGNEMTGDLFTLYDIEGYVAGSATASAGLMSNGFGSPTVQGTGITPTTQTPPDNPAIPNITFKYTSSMPLSNPTDTAVLLGTVSFKSTFLPGTAASVMISAASQRADNGHIANNVGSVIGPVIPEPATVLLCLAGLPLLGGAYVWRQRRR